MGYLVGTIGPMDLYGLSLANFRNFKSLDLEVPSGLVFFVGENAQGKSNLLEAVYLLAISKSYRVSTDSDLIYRGQMIPGEITLVSGKIHRKTDSVEIIVGLDARTNTPAKSGLRKQIRINGVPSRATDMIGVLNAVMFSADDMDLVYGPPAFRRRYIDVMLCQINQTYLRTLQRYQHVVAQRNAMLRNIRDNQAHDEEIEYWDEALSNDGASILQIRKQAVRFLNHQVRDMYHDLMGPGQELQVSYVSTVGSIGEESEEHETFRNAIASRLISLNRQERLLGHSLIGPHRDELKLSLGGIEIASCASRGEARMAALALRLAEGKFLARERGEFPVLLLDDVFSELDQRRREFVLGVIKGYPQALLTSADAQQLRGHELGAAHIFSVSDGHVSLEYSGIDASTVN